ncbi:MAG: efflux RND transporter permease subunit, partial [Gemmatimonadota bacterium]|nr:efflux RND transporter permease subunit [Gemmatimonadota bacterium]
KPETPTGAQKGLRTSFFAFTTTRPVAITMVVIAVAVFGLVSYQRLSLSLMPDISYPSITVRTEYPGTAPEEIETVISRPIEQALGIVSGLVSISSISRAGISDVVLEFSWDTDLDDAISQIREKLDRLYFQPEIKKPLILRYDPSLDPIVRLALYGVDDLYILRYIAEEEIERELEKLPGVAAVRVKGGLEEEIIVELDEGRLSTLNIGLDRVAGRLAQENINMAGGRLWEGQTEYLVRTLNEFKNLEEISDIVVETRGQALVRVRDLGRVYRGHKEREVITRAGGTESVEIEIYKEADANVVAVAEAISRRIYGSAAQKKFVAAMEKKEQEKQKQQEQEKDEKKAEKENEKKQGGKQDRARGKTMTDFLSYSLPDSVQIRTLFDQSVFIKNSIDEVRNTAVLGGLLAIIVLFIFLRNLPSTLIVSIAIPVSIIATFAPMYLFDVSLNIMSLGGLALGVGMLVDNSIVVLESIFRCRTEGDDTARAAVRGTGEVGGAVLASTLTTIAVFFPIVFVEGIAGQIFGDMSLTVVFSLLASLLVALFVIPMLASRRLENGSGAWRLKSVFRPTAGTSLARIKNSLETPGTAPGRRAALAGAGWLKILALEASALVWKPLYAIAAAVVSVIKGTLLVLAAVPLWLIALKTKKLPTRITALAGNHTLFGRDIFSRLWPGIICFQAPGHTLDSQQVLMGFLLRGGTAKRITKWLVLFLPAALYQVVFLVLALA